MNETGKVVKITGGDATVEFTRKASCENCGMCFGSKNAQKMELTLRNKVGAEVGDTVRVESKSSGVLLSMLIVYVVPLIVFFIGIIAAQLIFENNIVTFIVGAVFLVGGFAIVWLIDKKVGKSKRNTILPEIIRIEKSGKEENNEKEVIK